MHPDNVRHHIQSCREATSRPFGVNVPLMYPEIEKIIEVIVTEGVKIVFTSAGNPAKWTGYLKDRGITVAHVVSSSRFAVKAEQSGVDAVVAEGFEAGGHNGREETTTMVLLPLVRDAVKIPLLAAGGIGSGRAILAAEALGADGAQVGSRFAASQESSAHATFKERIVASGEGETMLTLKRLVPVRMIRNNFYNAVHKAELEGADADALRELLGKGRAKRGIFEGDLEEGELEIGQVSAAIHDIKPAAGILHDLWKDYLAAKKGLCP